MTPFGRSDALSDRLGFSAEGGVWIKDETGNVSGSHKARHLFGVLLQLEVAERLGSADPPTGPSSRSRAAATRRSPRLSSLRPAGERSASSSPWTPIRPCWLGSTSSARASRSASATTAWPATRPTSASCEALAEGALPFTCQGNLNGLAVEGGETLGYELVSSSPPPA